MSISKEEAREIIMDGKYPLSLKYDPDWILENQMGSQCLWLMEALTREMDLRPGMRVLDMGCGKAIGSIFLAKEFGVQVFATDLWINATENWKRICEAGVGDRVFPIHAEAHALPYAEGFFDAAVSINAFQFFATDTYYMRSHFAGLLKPGAQLGIVVPGLYKEFGEDIPEYIKPYWNPDFYSWHSPQWWQKHLDRTGLVKVRFADTFGDKEGNEMFCKFGIAVDNGDKLLPADEGRNISFVRIVALKI